MYEMEGPRLSPRGPGRRLPGCRAPRGCHRPQCPAARSWLSAAGVPFPVRHRRFALASRPSRSHLQDGHLFGGEV